MVFPHFSHWLILLDWHVDWSWLKIFGVEGAIFHIGNYYYKRVYFLVLRDRRHRSVSVYADLFDSSLRSHAKS